MKNEMIMAINSICVERELEPQVVFEAIEAALVSAHRRRYNTAANVSAQVDQKTGAMKIFVEQEVVATVEDDQTQISLLDARAIDTTADIGGVVLVESTPTDFGRIAAQTAKQVILQRIREAERDAILQRYQGRVGEIVHCTIRSVDYGSGTVTCTIDGKAEATLLKEDQIATERYRPNGKLRCYLVDVDKGSRGPVIRLSRTHRGLLRRLLEQEVPEIYNGAVEIKSIAREPGQRSKIAVAAMQPGVDPVGSCVGMRGVRIQAIVNELNNEKIDVVEWNPDPAQFIANALSPAKVTDVVLDDTIENRTAIVVVPDRQLSLAIGKEGQNARLSARLTGWRIDIKSEAEAEAEGLQEFAMELAKKRARLAMARARAESEDILLVAEQLLGDGEEQEGFEDEYADEYADEYESETAEEFVEFDEYAAIEDYVEEGADAPAAEPVVPEPQAAAEPPAVVAPAETVLPAGEAEFVDEYADIEEYDEYAAYEDYDFYDEYAAYDDMEGLDDEAEIDDVATPAAKSKGKPAKKGGKDKSKARPGRDRRGRSDWFGFSDD
ncbi:MAG: transcription termination factor NusA [Caldilineales bacterium]